MSGLQNILLESFSCLSEDDCIYGCSSLCMENNEKRLYEMQIEKKWIQIIGYHDYQLSICPDVASQKLVETLMACHLYNSSAMYLEHHSSSPKQQWIINAENECAWRLGKWIASEDYDQDVQPSFHRSVYKFLQCLHTKETKMLDHWINYGKQSVCDVLSGIGSENKSFISRCILELQVLSEMNSLKEIIHNTDKMISFWEKSCQLPADEMILSVKCAALDIITNTSENQRVFHQFLPILLLKKCQAEQAISLWHSAQNTLGCVQKQMSTYQGKYNLKFEVMLEEATITHATGEENRSKRILKDLIREVQGYYDEGQQCSIKLGKIVTLLSDWSLEDKSEHPKDIISNYLKPALESLKENSDELITVYCSLSKLADECYEQIHRYINSETFQDKQKFMKKNQEQVQELTGQSNLNKDQKIFFRTLLTNSKIDQDELNTVLKEKNYYLDMAILHHVNCLKFSNKYDAKIFRLIFLWLDNVENDEVHRIISKAVKSLPSYKWIPVMPQLTARLGPSVSPDSPGCRSFQMLLQLLVERCAVHHPYHVLPLLISLYLAYEDDKLIETSFRIKEEGRVTTAKNILEGLSKTSTLSELIQQMIAYFKMCIAFANKTQVGAKPSTSIPIPREYSQLCSRKYNLIPVLTCSFHIDKQANYNDIPCIISYDKVYVTVGGINQPKRLTVSSSCGKKYFQLLKGRDDLRQDAVMQQVFSTLNSILECTKETSEKKLMVRTYKVVPLSQRSGIIEWCNDTQPVGEYLAGPNGAHTRFRPQDWMPNTCRRKLQDAKGNDREKLAIFTEICTNLLPVFHHFFFENFLEPHVWFRKRQSYCRSMATNSMIGYILGIGDRHVQNILIDKTTAEVVHIDFGLAFEQGKVLQTPETVPFRLTRDFVDGMGIFGVEGTFRRSCEATMEVLRKNDTTICTLLEILLYDPLYLWTISSNETVKACKKRSNCTTDGGQINKLAERVLLRVRQKLHGIEQGTSYSTSAQVKWLIQIARDPHNLCKLYCGWQPYL